MMKALKKTAVKIRNYAVYRRYARWAATAEEDFPLDPSADFVVSMASYPGRIHLVPAVFESLARQTIHPRHSYLVLSVEDFPGRVVPQPIERLAERGVQIVWTERNPFAVKKLVPIWGKDPDLAVCTFDDDIIYGDQVLQGLRDGARAVDKAIVGYWGKRLYRRGPELNVWFRERKSPELEQSKAQTYLIAGSGVWYSPTSLHPSVTDLDAITRIVPGRGSDIWFWAAGVAAGATQVSLDRSPGSDGMRLWTPVPSFRRKEKPLDRPGREVLEERFQKAVDFFGIREHLLETLPDRAEAEALVGRKP